MRLYMENIAKISFAIFKAALQTMQQLHQGKNL